MFHYVSRFITHNLEMKTIKIFRAVRSEPNKIIVIYCSRAIEVIEKNYLKPGYPDEKLAHHILVVIFCVGAHFRNSII